MQCLGSRFDTKVRRLRMPRYTIDVDESFDKVLNDLMSSTGATTKADVIRRAVASYKALKANTPADSNRKVSITTDSDEIVKDIVLP
jgi:hypothetical protein